MHINVWIGMIVSYYETDFSGLNLYAHKQEKFRKDTHLHKSI